MAITTTGEEPLDVCLLRQYEEKLSDCKKELADVQNSLSLDLEEADELSVSQSNLEGEIFDCLLHVKICIGRPTELSSSLCDDKGVKLPKLNLPMFDGNILHWRTFWEQFCVSIHGRSYLADSDKLVYLQQSLKNCSAKSSIEGLSRSGEYYVEAVECLKARYDLPHALFIRHISA